MIELTAVELKLVQISVRTQTHKMVSFVGLHVQVYIYFRILRPYFAILLILTFSFEVL